MSFFCLVILFLFCPSPSLNWVLLSQAAHPFKFILVFFYSYFQNVFALIFNLLNRKQKLHCQSQWKTSIQGSHLSAAVVSNSSIKNLSVNLFKSKGNVFFMDSYDAELWLSLCSLLFLRFCRYLFRFILRQLLNCMPCAQSHGPPEALHGHWLEVNKCFVLVSSSSF